MLLYPQIPELLVPIHSTFVGDIHCAARLPYLVFSSGDPASYFKAQQLRPKLIPKGYLSRLTANSMKSGKSNGKSDIVRTAGQSTSSSRRVAQDVSRKIPLSI